MPIKNKEPDMIP